MSYVYVYFQILATAINLLSFVKQIGKVDTVISWFKIFIFKTTLVKKALMKIRKLSFFNVICNFLQVVDPRLIGNHLRKSITEIGIQVLHSQYFSAITKSPHENPESARNSDFEFASSCVYR